MIRFPLLSFASVMLAAPAALACAFHSYTPQPTLVDRLLGSEHIVLARNSADDPFRFHAVEAIEGQVDYVSIPVLVDSTTRRKLTRDTEAKVLFARDGAYGPWQRLAYVDESFEPVLEAIAEHLPAWELGDDAGRYRFFADLLNHADPAVHALALRELDQADFGMLRELDLDIPVDRLVLRLNIPAEYQLKPIRILLLGLAEKEETGAYLRQGLAATVNLGGGVFGAFTTAYLETHGPTGVDVISQEYLGDATLPLEARELLLEALAIHGAAGAPETAATVRLRLEEALQRDASLAPGVARHFGVRANWSLYAPLADILQANKLTSINDLLLVSQYVALAEGAQSETQ